MTIPGVAAAEDAQRYVEVLALGCRLPIPANYLLNTRERAHFTWYDVDLLKLGRINIWEHREYPDESYELLNKRQQGPLTLLELRSKSKQVGLPSNDPLRELTVIYNGAQEVVLGADARVHADYMLNTCAKQPEP